VSAAVWWEIGQTVILLGLVFLLVGLTYTVASIRVRLGPETRPSSLLQAGAAAPQLRGSEARSGQAVVLEDLARSGRATVVAFLSPTCGACVNEVPKLNALADGNPGVAFIAVIEEGNGFDFQSDLSRSIHVIADSDRLLQAAFDVKMFPHLAVIDGSGTLAATAVERLSDVAAILQPMLRHREPSAGLTMELRQ